MLLIIALLIITVILILSGIFLGKKSKETKWILFGLAFITLGFTYFRAVKAKKEPATSDKATTTQDRAKDSVEPATSDETTTPLTNGPSTDGFIPFIKIPSGDKTLRTIDSKNHFAIFEEPVNEQQEIIVLINGSKHSLPPGGQYPVIGDDDKIKYLVYRGKEDGFQVFYVKDLVEKY